MKVSFSQIYISPGISFPFSHLFQRYLTQQVTALSVPSDLFLSSYGPDFDLDFNISANEFTQGNDIKGPAVFRKSKAVEYTIFLPYSVIVNSPRVPQEALRHLFQGVYYVYDLLNMDSSAIKNNEEAISHHICSDNTMFRNK